MDYFATSGHFHVVLLHLPIGLIAGVGLLELLTLRPGGAGSRAPVRLLLWLVAASAAMVASTGYILSLEPGYVADTVSLHMWLGIAFAALSVVTLAAHEFALRAAPSGTPARSRLLPFRLGLLGMVGLIVPVGHLGGTLTHGDDFLFVSSLESKQHEGIAQDSPELTEFIANIQPVLESNCYACHGEAKQKAGLALHTPESILAGSRNGPVIDPADPKTGELIRRLQLPLEHDDHMPPQGKPQPSEDQVRAIKAWIAGGASFTSPLSATVQATVEPTLPAATPPAAAQPTHPDAPTAAADSAALANLRTALAHVQAIEPGSPLLWIDFAAPSGAAQVTDDRIAALLPPVAGHVQDLSLARSGITDRSAALIAGMVRLRRLDLSRTAITDAGVTLLGSLKNLEELNLVGTSVTDASLPDLANATNLQRLFLWSTQVTPDGVERLRAARPGLVIETGSSLTGQTLAIEDAPELRTSALVEDVPSPAANQLKPVNSTCPVSNAPVDPRFVIVYEGRVIGFCCSNCPKKFWDDPATFLRALANQDVR